MLIHHNHLREHRKRSLLTQEDVAFILGLVHSANISRFEQSQRQPKLEVLLGYHILFNLPIGDLFERQRQSLISEIIHRIRNLVKRLKNNPADITVVDRISFLDSVLTRLTDSAKNV